VTHETFAQVYRFWLSKILSHLKVNGKTRNGKMMKNNFQRNQNKSKNLWNNFHYKNFCLVNLKETKEN
jgi:hypothetical protein